MERRNNSNLENQIFSATSKMKQWGVSRKMIGGPDLHHDVVLILHANGETGYRAVVGETHYSKGIKGTIIERNR